MSINRATLGKEVDGVIEYIYPKTSADMVEYTAEMTVEQKIRSIDTDITATNSRISNIVAQAGTDNTEIVDARTPVFTPADSSILDSNGACATLKDRLSADFSSLSNEMDDKLKNFKAIAVSEEEPTEENTSIWINPNAKESFSMPEIDDNSENENDTWSSKKISREINGLKGNLVELMPLVEHEAIGRFYAEYEIGHIDRAGSNIINEARIRTKNAYAIEDIQSINISTDMQYTIHLYKDWTSATSFTRYYDSDWIDGETIIQTLLETYPLAKYIRWSAEYKVAQPITDINDTSSNLNVIGTITVEGEFDKLKNKVENEFGTVSYTKDDFALYDGYIKYSDGTVGALSDIKYTDYIPVKAYKSITVSNVNLTAHDARGLAFYDADKKYISGYQYNGSDSFSVNVPQYACYLRITINALLVDNAEVKISIFDFTKKVSSILLDETPEELPFDNIIKSGGFMSLFHKIGCIGDSLASGETYYNNSGDGKNHALSPNFDISWGQNIARACGITAYNFSRGGQTAKTWFSEWGNHESFVNNPCTAYIIGLGVNDSNPSSGAYTQLGTSADINLSDYTQNADSFYGNYAKVIQRVKELQPKAKIFIMTVPTGTKAEVGYNDAIRYMTTIFENVYLMDFRLYGEEIYKDLWIENSAYCYNGHGTALLYQISAWHIMSYVDYIVRHNPLEFKEVQFIGTEYAIVD